MKQGLTNLFAPFTRAFALAAALLVLGDGLPGPASPLLAQGRTPLVTEHFSTEEFQTRREAVYDAIGPDAIAIIQGAPYPVGYVRFRQSNEFYYLSGVETPHAYLVLDGGARATTIYLPNRNERREASEGKILSAEDAELARSLTGIEEVHSTDRLTEDLSRYQSRSEHRVVYTPFQPAEGASTSRSWAARTNADIAADPFDGRVSREGHFRNRLGRTLPALDLRDLSPALDELRLIKSPAELELLRRSARLAGEALLEAMRSTRPGVYEHELDGLAQFIFFRHGSQADAYYSLIAGGENRWYAHYHAGTSPLRGGEMVLMDYSPDYGYYASDVTRMWPVNGRFDDRQRELYGFYLEFYEAILNRIRPGVTAQQIMQEALVEHERLVEEWEFSRNIYERAARSFVDQYRARAEDPDAGLGHWVGMATHDVGRRGGMIRPGMVFVIEPQFRIPEERTYIRLEDPIVVTETGAESLIEFVPRDMESIERIMREEGLLQRYPRILDHLR